MQFKINYKIYTSQKKPPFLREVFNHNPTQHESIFIDYDWFYRRT